MPPYLDSLWTPIITCATHAEKVIDGLAATFELITTKAPQLSLDDILQRPREELQVETLYNPIILPLYFMSYEISWCWRELNIDRIK